MPRDSRSRRRPRRRDPIRTPMRSPAAPDEYRFLSRNEAVAEDADDDLLRLANVLLRPRQPAEHPACEDLLERAVDDPGGEPRRQIGAELPLLLATLDDALECLE